MDLIQVRNPNLFKDMFQETLYEQKKTATLEVLKVSGTYPSLVNDNDNFYIECKILSDLPDCTVDTLPELLRVVGPEQVVVVRLAPATGKRRCSCRDGQQANGYKFFHRFRFYIG